MIYCFHLYRICVVLLLDWCFTWKLVFQAQMATAHRLAAQTTNASRARAVVATTKPAAPMKPSAATTEIATKLTRPEPFSFATTARPKAGPASGPMRAEEAVDFSKMLRNFNAANPTVCLLSTELEEVSS